MFLKVLKWPACLVALLFIVLALIELGLVVYQGDGRQRISSAISSHVRRCLILHVYICLSAFLVAGCGCESVSRSTCEGRSD